MRCIFVHMNIGRDDILSSPPFSSPFIAALKELALFVKRFICEKFAVRGKQERNHTHGVLADRLLACVSLSYLSVNVFIEASSTRIIADTVVILSAIKIYIWVAVAMVTFSAIVYLLSCYVVAAAAFLYAAYRITHSAALLSFCSKAAP